MQLKFKKILNQHTVTSGCKTKLTAIIVLRYAVWYMTLPQVELASEKKKNQMAPRFVTQVRTKISALVIKTVMNTVAFVP